MILYRKMVNSNKNTTKKLITSLIKELTIFNPTYILYKKDIFVQMYLFTDNTKSSDKTKKNTDILILEKL
ncbi:hypothetical protein IW22_17030 [Chryseobacterium sp. JM1]|nr:hypothetical protein IW22_17030 [Chryseobacterium sp. JM1]